MLTNRNKDAVPGMVFTNLVILGVAIVAIVYAFSTGISGNDFWWHIKVGEWVCANGSVPNRDVFSWYASGRQLPWVAHEWLSDVLLYWVHNLAGNLGVFLLSVGGALAMTLLLWHETQKTRQNNLLISGLFFVLFAVTTSLFFYGRPHLFSFFLLFAELKLLYRFFEDPKSKGIWALPLIACLWGNLHGGSSNLSYLLCIVFLVVGVLNIRIGCVYACRLEKKALFKLLGATVLTVCALALNPFGLKLLLYPYENMGDKLMLAVISEWAAPDAKNLGNLILFYLPIVLMLLGFFARDKEIRLIDLAIMGLFMLLFLRSVRFIMLWYIAAPFCAFVYMPRCKIKPVQQKWEKVLLAVCALLVLVPLIPAAENLQETIRQDRLVTTVLSDGAVERVKQDAPERLFNDYNLGEALIYNDVPVFFDARADVYKQEMLLADGVSLMLLEQANTEAGQVWVDPEALIAKYNFDAILILKERPLYVYLRSHPERYTCVFEEDSVGYFRVAQP